MNSQKKKLIIDCRMLHHSGIGRYIKELVPQVVSNFNTTLLLPTIHKGFAEQLNLPFIIFDVPIYSIKEQLAYLKINSGDSIFWSPHYNSPLLPIPCKAKVTTIHDVYHLAFQQELSFVQRNYAKLMIGAAVRSSKKVITVSDFSKEEIIRHTRCNESKIHVIPNGVKQVPVYKDIASIQEKYGLPQRFILFVGNVKPHKNIKCLLKAFAELNQQLRSNFKIVVVGKKDGFITKDNGLFQWIEVEGLEEHIRFTGIVDEEHLDSIYAAASLLVFPSLYEGFGLPPLEAMINKCPVIASESSSMPEVCGDAVLYFNPRQPTELKRQIEKVLTDTCLQENLKKNGALRATKFTWSESVVKHINLLEAII